MTKRETVLAAICDEVDSAQWRYPNWPTDILYQIAIMAEESGEAVQAAVQYAMENGELEAVKREVIQTAAMCVRFLELHGFDNSTNVK